MYAASEVTEWANNLPFMGEGVVLAFETGFLFVALAALELTEIHLPLPPRFWD